MSTLYLKNFGLSKRPFSLTPDTDFFFRGDLRGALLDGICQAVTDDQGMVVVTGEVGTGKTMMARMLRRTLTASGHTVVYLPDASLDPVALMCCIADELGVMDASEPGTVSPVPGIQKALRAIGAKGQPVVLMADEAHTFRTDSLDALRMLSNIETEQDKLLQVVLFGQPELHDLLAQHGLRQVRDRVAHWFTLEPLSQANAVRYLEHRLGCAGSAGAELIDSTALDAIVTAAQGRPRALNMLADKALLSAYAHGANRVKPEHVDDGARALDPTPSPRVTTIRRPRPARMSLALLFGCLAASVSIWMGLRSVGPSQPHASLPSLPTAQEEHLAAPKVASVTPSIDLAKFACTASSHTRCRQSSK